MNRTLEKRDHELNQTRRRLDRAETKLVNTTNILQSTKLECKEQKHLVEKMSRTEEELSAQARSLLDAAAGHAKCLHDTVDKRRSVESCNLQVTRAYREQAARHRGTIAAAAKHFAMSLGEGLNELHTALEDFTSSNKTTLQGDKGKLEDILRQIQETMHEIKIVTDESHSKLVSATDSQRDEIRASVQSNNNAIQVAVQRAKLLQRAVAALHTAQSQDITGNVAKFVQQWYVSASGRVSSLCACARRLEARSHAHASAHARIAAAHRDAAARTKQQDSLVQALNEKVERDNAELEHRLSEQVSVMEAERADTQGRLQAWVEGERRAFEQRLQAHVEKETAALEQRLSKKMEAIKRERLKLQARMSSHLELQERLLEASAEDMRLMIHHVQEWETSGRDAVEDVTSYVSEFDEGATVVSADPEIFWSNVVEVVVHLCHELLTGMRTANQQTEGWTVTSFVPDGAGARLGGQ